MVVKASKRLDGVARLSHRQVEDAAREVGTANARLDKQKESESLLHEAREKHVSRIDAALDSGSSALHLKVMRQAVANLDQGLHQVSRTISAAEDERAARVAELAEKQRRQEMIERVIARRRKDEQAADDKRTQNTIDDLVGSRYRRKERD